MSTDHEVPLAELHCHLNGSVRVSTLLELAREQGRRFPVPLERLVVAGPEVTSLPEYLRCSDVAVGLLQEPAALRRAARELVADWITDGVAHGEMRIAPQLHTAGGMTLHQVVDAVVAGIREAPGGCTARLILACLRQHDPAVSRAVARLALEWGDPVVGFDVAGDERLPVTPHVPAFDLARAGGLRITAHAGEGAGPESVRQVLDEVRPERIGHGVTSAGDDALVARLARERIVLETCPTSNLQTRAVPPGAGHPAVELLGHGVLVTISTDNRTISATTLPAEYARLGLTAEQHDRLRRNAWAHRFD